MSMVRGPLATAGTRFIPASMDLARRRRRQRIKSERTSSTWFRNQGWSA